MDKQCIINIITHHNTSLEQNVPIRVLFYNF